MITAALYRVGRLHAEQLGNQEEGVAALERAAAVSSHDPSVLEALAHLYEAVERWEGLADVLRRLVNTIGEPEERLPVFARLGQLCEEQLHDDVEAMRWYRSAVATQPTYLPALQALGKLYRRRADWNALIEMRLAEANATEDAERRAASHARIGELFERELNQPDDAADHHGRALAQVPGYSPSFKALARLLATAGRWRDLVELYERAVDRGGETPHRAITYLLKIGGIYEDHLGEPAQAAHTYRRILTLDPNHLGAIHAPSASHRACRTPP